MNTDCQNCFHYGKSLITSKVGCVLEDRLKVDPEGHCGYFVEWSGKE